VAVNGACHGRAGDGEFLLDLASFTGEERYRDEAMRSAALLYARHAVRDGLALIPDDSGLRFGTGYASGMAGILGFLLRLRHGGPGWWMPEDASYPDTTTEEGEES
jgi:hypothetical protein